MRTWNEEEIRDALRLYAVTDRSWLRGRSFKEVLQETLSAGGITCVQLREKHAAPEEKETLAREAQALCAQAGIPFLIDDDVELALRIGADGVHIGQMISPVLRRVVRLATRPSSALRRNARAARKAEAEGADYLGVARCSQRRRSKTRGRSIMRYCGRFASRFSIPVVAIGGITADNARELAGTGIAGIAVVFSDLRAG